MISIGIEIFFKGGKKKDAGFVVAALFFLLFVLFFCEWKFKAVNPMENKYHGGS